MAGCVTVRHSRVPVLIEQLNRHDFTPAQRETIGELLHYINDLEHDTHRAN